MSKNQRQLEVGQATRAAAQLVAPCMGHDHSVAGTGAPVLSDRCFGGHLADRPRFLEISNLSVVTRQTSFIALVSLGQLLCLIVGVIDFSVGTTAGFAGICVALLMNGTPINPYLAMLAGILVGATVGLVNGLLVTRVKLNPLSSRSPCRS